MSSVKAGVVVNEVLANEPGSTTSLEWLELFNDGATVSLDGYALRIGDNVIAFPDNITLAQEGYLVVCRRLYATTTSPGFESYWGDSSGVWGDTEFESGIATPLELGISLTNAAGNVELLSGGMVISAFGWSSSGLDGHSWERVRPDGDSIAQSVAQSGSTPGSVNSVTPSEYDLAVRNVTVRSNRGTTLIDIEISNVGFEPVESSRLYLINSSMTPEDTFDVFDIGGIAPGEIFALEQEYILDGMYIPMTAALAPDDRESNNCWEFMGVGQEYPPLIISEFLANPQDGLVGEWIELKNRSDEAVDLSGWFCGDRLRVNAICGETAMLESGAYVVLAQDTLGFVAFYTDFEGAFIKPGSWSSLNNDGDMVRLVDCYGIEADRFEYEAAYEGNYTWCRTEEPLEFSRWGRSTSSGGTPGKANEVVLSQASSKFGISVDPPYVSPDGDGIEDFTTITIEAPPASSYTVKIYDRQGRVVRTFYEDASMIPSQIDWDGLSSAGKRLPVGLYIIYVEASGVDSAKKPIVVAR